MTTKDVQEMIAEQGADHAEAAGMKKDKRPWMVALVPLFSVGGMSQPRWEEAILIDDATAEERERFHQILIEIKWLPPKARSAILQALGSSPRKRNLRDEMPRIGRLEYQIRVHKRPLKKIADAEGITVAALKKRLQRFRKRERPGKEEIARREEEIARRMKEVARRVEEIARLKEAEAGKREK